MTDAERIFWRAVRAHRLEGLGFRRQVPIGSFIVDFYCPEAKLVVEIDGSQHADSEDDAIRDAWLEANGVRVLRFWNNDVTSGIEGVLHRVLQLARPEIAATWFHDMDTAYGPRLPSPGPMPI